MRDAVVGAGALGRQDFGGAPAPYPTVGAARDVDACHALEEGGGVLASLCVGRGHGQCRARAAASLLVLSAGLSSP